MDIGGEFEPVEIVSVVTDESLAVVDNGRVCVLGSEPISRYAIATPHARTARRIVNITGQLRYLRRYCTDDAERVVIAFLCHWSLFWLKTTELTRSPVVSHPLDNDQIGDSGPAIGYAISAIPIMCSTHAAQELTTTKLRNRWSSSGA
jgi:hypothetical protein